MRLRKQFYRVLSNGRIPKVIEGPFIIMRQVVKVPPTNCVAYEWDLITDPTDPDGDVQIDAHTAWAIIKEQHMELAYSKSYGQIYELPGAPFKSRYFEKAC